MYTRLVYIAGFSEHGREWIANGVCSFVIGFLTFQVRRTAARALGRQRPPLMPCASAAVDRSMPT